MHRKCNISTGFQDEFRSYVKLLAKWPNMIEIQYFWPKDVTLAKFWPYIMPKNFLANIWPLLHTRKPQKMRKQLQHHTHFVQNSRIDMGVKQVVGQESKLCLRCLLWPKNGLVRCAKASQILELALGQVLATFSCIDFDENIKNA